MIAVRLYNKADEKAWNDFVSSSRTPMFMFDRGFVEYHSDRFVDCSLMFFRDDELIAVMPASRHGDEVRSHGGLTYGGIISSDGVKQRAMLECFEAMKEFLLNEGVRKLVYKKIPWFYATKPAEEDTYALFKAGAMTMKIEPASVINLKNPSKMPKGRKAQISRARREGVLVQETEDFDSFIALENQVLNKQHGVNAVHSADEIRLLKSRFPENIKCIVGFYNGEMIAGTLLFVYDNVVHTQYLSANDKAREIGALDLVVSDVINRYSQEKQWLDFGISSEEGGNVLNEGLISQKEGFGGRTVVYETYKLNLF